VACDVFGNVHVVWTEVGYYFSDVYYMRKPAGGSDVRLTDYYKIDRYPAVAVDSQGFVHVVWVRNRDGWQLFYKELSDSGWGPQTMLEPTFCNHPAIAVGPDDAIHLVWDGRGSSGITYTEIYYKERDESGWNPKVRLTVSDATSRYPSVETDVYGNIHVAWFDLRDGNDEIYYCIREGGAWGPAERITDDPAFSQLPSIATDSMGSVHLVWWDTRDDSTAELYYKQRYAPGAGLTAPDTPPSIACKVEVSPNPARSEVRLAYWLASPDPASLVVVDIAGRVVWRASCASFSQGWKSATWMCRDMMGQRVAPGIYLVRVQGGTSGTAAKIVVIK
jgi:hypothetical protein